MSDDDDDLLDFLGEEGGKDKKGITLPSTRRGSVSSKTEGFSWLEQKNTAPVTPVSEPAKQERGNSFSWLDGPKQSTQKGADFSWLSSANSVTQTQSTPLKMAPTEPPTTGRGTRQNLTRGLSGFEYDNGEHETEKLSTFTPNKTQKVLSEPNPFLSKSIPKTQQIPENVTPMKPNKPMALQKPTEQAIPQTQQQTQQQTMTNDQFNELKTSIEELQNSINTKENKTSNNSLSQISSLFDPINEKLSEMRMNFDRNMSFSKESDNSLKALKDSMDKVKDTVNKTLNEITIKSEKQQKNNEELISLLGKVLSETKSIKTENSVLLEQIKATTESFERTLLSNSLISGTDNAPNFEKIAKLKETEMNEVLKMKASQQEREISLRQRERELNEKEKQIEFDNQTKETELADKNYRFEEQIRDRENALIRDKKELERQKELIQKQRSETQAGQTKLHEQKMQLEQEKLDFVQKMTTLRGLKNELSLQTQQIRQQQTQSRKDKEDAEEMLRKVHYLVEWKERYEDEKRLLKEERERLDSDRASLAREWQRISSFRNEVPKSEYIPSAPNVNPIPLFQTLQPRSIKTRSRNLTQTLKELSKMESTLNAQEEFLDSVSRRMK